MSVSKAAALPSKTLELNEALMMLRYYSKFTLQYCAVLSQLSLHEEALVKAKRASQSCESILFLTFRLCK